MAQNRGFPEHGGMTRVFGAVVRVANVTLHQPKVRAHQTDPQRRPRAALLARCALHGLAQPCTRGAPHPPAEPLESHFAFVAQ